VAFRKLLDPAQAFVRGRELTKANWAQACRAFRPPLMELGRRLAASGLIENAEELAFLRLDELRRAVAGGLLRTEARRLVKARKAEFEALHGYELPVTFQLPLTMSEVRPVQPAGPVLLTGMAVSQGVATGRARVILDAEAEGATIEPGDVLVAPFTDAPWTPLFFPAAAVVVERGGMLSHASTVAREFGIPAVVSVPHATELIRDGAMVTVDGNRGTVTLG
jgi:pyruvate,water dikinase